MWTNIGVWPGFEPTVTVLEYLGNNEMGSYCPLLKPSPENFTPTGIMECVRKRGAEEMRGFGSLGSCANLKIGGGGGVNSFRLLSISDADLYLIHMAYDLGKTALVTDPTCIFLHSVFDNWHISVMSKLFYIFQWCQSCFISGQFLIL
jgi:hypothetical protein